MPQSILGINEVNNMAAMEDGFGYCVNSREQLYSFVWRQNLRGVLSIQFSDEICPKKFWLESVVGIGPCAA